MIEWQALVVSSRFARRFHLEVQDALDVATFDRWGASVLFWPTGWHSLVVEQRYELSLCLCIRLELRRK